MPDALCAVCRREPRGFGWFESGHRVSDRRRDASRRRLCSRACQEICLRRRGMIDPTESELAAMTHGGRMGGDYLESIGKSDLARLSLDEWSSFIDCVVTGYCDALRDLAAPLEGAARR